MNIKKDVYLAWIFGVLLCPSLFAQTFTLDQALEQAVKNDFVLAQIASNFETLKANAVASAQLPDPKATLAFQNFPVNDFNQTREGMTQIVTGISQRIPRGKTLKYRGKQAHFRAKSVKAETYLRSATVRLNVRRLWFDLYYWSHAENTISQGENLLQQIIQATELQYGTGGSNVQDLMSAELELSVLQDKKIDAQRKVDTLQAELFKWLGNELVQSKLDKTFPQLPPVQAYDAIEQLLTAHPQVQAVDAMIESEQQGVNIAKAQYKPGFDIGLSYGFRKGDLPNEHERPDFLTAKLTFDLPLFVNKRQDQELAASSYKVSAVQYQRDNILRNLQAQLQGGYANWQRYDERVAHYDRIVIRRAKASFEASLEAYSEDRTNFASLMRAQVVELDTQLNYIKIKTDRAKAQAHLLYLQGDTHE